MHARCAAEQHATAATCSSCTTCLSVTVLGRHLRYSSHHTRRPVMWWHHPQHRTDHSSSTAPWVKVRRVWGGWASFPPAPPRPQSPECTSPPLWPPTNVRGSTWRGRLSWRWVQGWRWRWKWGGCRAVGPAPVAASHSLSHHLRRHDDDVCGELVSGGVRCLARTFMLLLPLPATASQHCRRLPVLPLPAAVADQ